MRQRLHDWMEEKGRGLTRRRMRQVGWLSTGLGLVLLVVLGWTGSEDVGRYAGALMACAGRPFIGWLIARSGAGIPE